MTGTTTHARTPADKGVVFCPYWYKPNYCSECEEHLYITDEEEKETYSFCAHAMAFWEERKYDVQQEYEIKDEPQEVTTMGKEKGISDEKIISALLANGTIKDAAAAAGISERALYDRMNTGEFQALYKSAKADLIRSAVFSINRQLQAAIDTTAEIMADKENNPAVRLQAAQTILNNAGKFAKRLQDDESSTLTQISDNAFGLW